MRVFFQAFEADGIQIERHARVKLPWGDRLLLGDLPQRLNRVGCLERRPAGEQCIENCTERIDVRRWTNRFRLACCLLWWHVARRAEDLAGSREAAVGVDALGQAEVSDPRLAA